VGSALFTAIDEKPKRTDPSRLRRVTNIQSSPTVCLLVDDYDDDWRRLRWLQVRGHAVLVTHAGERHAALGALRQRYTAYREMQLEARPLIRIMPESVVRWSARQAPPS
jgi:PPOX class probable F420-dependent enzyme